MKMKEQRKRLKLKRKKPKENLYIEQLSGYDVWLANYTGATQEDPLKKPTNYKGKYVMWQYTDSGTVNGIKGKVDCDVFYYLK
jgi:GH25 family lysozyme M1 (1,4-beta-N-acetylmuramidase)